MTINATNHTMRVGAGGVLEHPPAGGFTHGSAFTVTGTGFGTKPTAAPKKWDDCSGTDPLNTWDGAWPTVASQPSSAPRYAASGSIGGVTAPHSQVGSVLAARAYDEGGGGTSGNNQMLWHSVPSISFPQDFYISWYRRDHPSYDPGDNHKIFDYSGGLEPYDSGTDYWYLLRDPYFGGGYSHSANNMLFQQVCSAQSFRDFMCNSKYYTGSAAPHQQWIKYEVILRASDDNNVGFYDFYEDGEHKINLGTYGSGTHSFTGRTDNLTEFTSRVVSIGGYNRLLSLDNWAFFADLYLDDSLARVFLGNNADPDLCTIREIQPLTSWADTSIGFDCNQGVFTTGQTAWIHVIDSTNTAVHAEQVTIG